MSRLGKRHKWIWIYAGAAIAVLLMIRACYVWSPGRRLELRLDALRAAGEPVQVADLAREPIPPETNANTFLRRAEEDLAAIQKELTASYPKTVYPTGPLPPADREKLEELFAAHPKVMPLLERAAACPDYDPQIAFTLPASRILEPDMDRTRKPRALARVLRAYSALRLSQGRPDDALDSQVLLLRLTRAWRREPLLIGYFMTTACEAEAMEGANQVLQSGPISPAARQALDAELALHDSLEGLRWALQSERAFSVSMVREPFGSVSWPLRYFANNTLLGILDLFEHHLENASRPYAEAVSRKYAAPPRGGLPNPFQVFATGLDPSLVAARETAERSRARPRSLRVLNALQVRSSGDDHAPDLADLALPPEATIDPFNGQPLHVKKLPEGWMVYSVGPDGVDDGGKLDGETDIGFGPIGRSREESRK